jgi:hypothetical protein
MLRRSQPLLVKFLRRWLSEDGAEVVAACLQGVAGCRCDYVGITAAVPRIAADLLHCSNRQGRANCGVNCRENKWGEICGSNSMSRHAFIVGGTGQIGRAATGSVELAPCRNLSRIRQGVRRRITLNKK